MAHSGDNKTRGTDTLFNQFTQQLKKQHDLLQKKNAQQRTFSDVQKFMCDNTEKFSLLLKDCHKKGVTDRELAVFFLVATDGVINNIKGVLALIRLSPDANQDQDFYNGCNHLAFSKVVECIKKSVAPAKSNRVSKFLEELRAQRRALSIANYPQVNDLAWINPLAFNLFLGECEQQHITHRELAIVLLTMDSKKLKAGLGTKLSASYDHEKHSSIMKQCIDLVREHIALLQQQIVSYQRRGTVASVLRVNDGSLEPLPAQKMSVGGGGCDSKETPHHQAQIARVTTRHLMEDDSTRKIASSRTQGGKVMNIMTDMLITYPISSYSPLDSAANFGDGAHPSSGSKSAGSTHTAS